MAAKPLPSPEVIRQLLRYEPETGKLFWRERPVEMFCDTEKRQASQSCMLWNARHAGKQAFTHVSDRGYLCGRVHAVLYRAHRIAWVIYHGSEPKVEIDHINCVKTDNRISNLRLARRSDNVRNKGVTCQNVSGLKGVGFHRRTGKWRARICVDGVDIHIGLFRSKEEANAAYTAEARRIYGEFAHIR